MRKGVKVFVALFMILSIVGCGTKAKDYAEIAKIFKDNSYQNEVLYDCSYVCVEKDGHRWIKVDKSNDIYYRDINADDGIGVVNLNDENLYAANGFKEKLTSKNDQKIAKKYLESNEKKLKALDLNEKDVATFLNNKLNKKKKEYKKLSKRERLEKEFDSKYLSALSDNMINKVYQYYSKNKFDNTTYESLCENFVNYGPYAKQLSKYNKLLLEGDTGKFGIEINSLISNDENLGVFYNLMEYGSAVDVNYIMLFDFDKKEVTGMSCSANSSVDKSDFYLWSMVLMKLLTQKDYTGQEWLSVLANTVSSPVRLDDWSFKLDTSNGYKFMAFPS